MPSAKPPTNFLGICNSIYGTLYKTAANLYALVLPPSESPTPSSSDYDVEAGTSPRSCFVKIKPSF